MLLLSMHGITIILNIYLVLKYQNKRSIRQYKRLLRGICLPIRGLAQNVNVYCFKVCRKIGEGAKALVFVGTSKSTMAMHSISDALSIPVLTPLSTKHSQSQSEFIVSLRPSLNRPIIDVIERNGWNRIFYLFDSDEGTSTE